MPVGHKRLPLHLLWIILLLTVISVPCLAADKNGVSPKTISLPSGPGSIEGLGESFQPMLNTGTAKYAVKIVVPPGVNGHAPQLALSYDGGLGDGPVGIGWNVGPGGISRETDKGIPRYVDGPNGADDDHDGLTDEYDEQDRFRGPDGEELVLLADGSYRARIEGSFVRYRRVGAHWEADLKDGTLLEFGVNPAGRINDETETGQKVARWLLERSTDTNGNTIEYSYSSLPGSDNQKYLKEIRYGPGAPPWAAFYFVSFTYEDRPDWRKDYRYGFLVKRTKRLAQIDMGLQGAFADGCAPGDWNGDSGQDHLIRRYLLSYEAHAHWSYLSKVTRFGADGVNYLPPISFSYSIVDLPPSTSAAGALIGSQGEPSNVMDSELVELVDLNADALPDLLHTDFGGGSHTAYLNRGVQGDPPNQEVVWESQEVTSSDGLALDLYLMEDKIHLADMDGDGISDLVQKTLVGDVFYYRNEGDFSWGDRAFMSIQDTSPPAPFGDTNVELSDLDFDKRIDVVQSTEYGYSTWFNLGGGRYSAEIRTAGAEHQGQAILFSQTGAHLSDMNGDRMNDVVRIRPTLVFYSANKSHGDFDPTVTITLPDQQLTEDQIEKARLQDINGDGLSDLVLERATSGELWYWLNLGTDAFDTKRVITGMPTTFGIGMVTRWADINGNGTTDLIYADSDADPRIRALDIGSLAGGSTHPNLLTRIDNGLGVVTNVEYQSSTEQYLQAQSEDDPWTTAVPFPVSVVARVVTTTGLDLDNDPGLDQYMKDYAYRDGYYDYRERAFRGFEHVKVVEHGDPTAPTSVTLHNFFTGGPDGEDNDGDGQTDEVSPNGHREEEALKGNPRSVELRAEDDFLFWREESDWRVRNLTVSPDSVEVRFAFNEMTDKLIYEGESTPETIRTTYAYDDYGNVTEEKKHGALSIIGDEVFTYTEFIHNTSLWLLDKPQRQYQTDGLGQKPSESRFYYDGPAHIGLGMGQIEKGNLSRQEGWVSGTTYINLVRNGYDAYGNIIATMDGEGNLRSLTYDGVLNMYPVLESIEVGGGSPDLSISVDYNLGLGVITQSTDFNGYETRYRYDYYGRLVKIVRPGDSDLLPSLSFDYTLADPENGLLYDYDEAGILTLTQEAALASSVLTSAREASGQAGTFDSIRYVDGMGRKLALVQEAATGFLAKEALVFNAKGSTRFTFLPYSVASQAFQAPSMGESKTESIYDAAGRPVLRVNPPDKDGAVTGAITQHLPLEKVETDENLNAKRFFYDGLERLIEVHEENGTDIYVTTYEYDPLGNLAGIVDAQNNVKTMYYDGLGRKVEMNDPDAGRKTYVYDSAGNLIQTTDNKGQVVQFTYDGANRVLAEDYLDSAAKNPDVTFHYDATSPEYPYATNTKGELAWVEDLSGASFFSYDPVGNVEWMVKRIAGGDSKSDYRLSYMYDAMSRVKSMTYPDGDRIYYVYDDGALLQSIPAIVSEILYHPSGQIDSILYANNVLTEYSYDPRYRLTRLKTTSQSRTQEPLQDLHYTMDGVNNITSIVDGRVLPPDSPKSASQTFAYDDLYRLVHAEGLGYGEIDFQYDRIGNMIYKKSPEDPDPGHIDDPLINLGNMTIGGKAGSHNRNGRDPGDPPGPHAVTSTESGLTYEYDDNGNMISHTTGDIYTWDFTDRLVRLQKASVEAIYTYDYASQRVIRKVRDNTSEEVTKYINQEFEVRDGKPTKYIFAGPRRIARIEGRLTDPGETLEQTIPLRSGWNYFSLEVEPSDPSVGRVLEAIEGLFTALWTYDNESSTYIGYVPLEGIEDLTALHAQTGYLIHATAPASLNVSGTRLTNDLVLRRGWNLISSPSATPLDLEEALASLSGLYESVWFYDPLLRSWRCFAPGAPQFLSHLGSLQPGCSYWIKSRAPGQLDFAEDSAQVYFYHPDHLGSTNVVTDFESMVVENTEFYPFGRPRYDERSNFTSRYKYTAKELDQESGLTYYGARFYDAALGSFVSIDPLYLELNGLEDDSTGDSLRNPQILNLMSYSVNNPIRFIDPDGFGTVEITYEAEDGVSKTISMKDPTTSQFIDMISELPEASISALKIEGHGDPLGLSIEFGSSSSGHDLIAGNPVFFSGQSDRPSFADAIKDKLKEGSTIILDGCWTAVRDDNIAKKLSLDLSNVKGLTVKGNPLPVLKIGWDEDHLVTKIYKAIFPNYREKNLMLDVMFRALPMRTYSQGREIDVEYPSRNLGRDY